jgi:hypothetical protein
MSTGKQRFTQMEVARALRAAISAGIANPRVEIDPRTGKLCVAAGESQAVANQPTSAEWDKAIA